MTIATIALGVMLGSCGAVNPPAAGAADVTPAEAAELDPSRVAAVLLAFGSPHAHNVILLRAKGIPVIIGAGPAVLSIPDGTVVAKIIGGVSFDGLERLLAAFEENE